MYLLEDEGHHNANHPIDKESQKSHGNQFKQIGHQFITELSKINRTFSESLDSTRNLFIDFMLGDPQITLQN